MDSKKLTAEFIGTFALIFIGAGSAAIGGSLVAVALAHACVVIGFIYAYGDISGVHINPAVTISLATGGRIGWVDAAGYIVVQMLGGIAGAFTLAAVVGTDTGLGATVLAADVNPMQGLFIEVILTFFLVNAIYHAAVSNKAGEFAPLAIGITLTFAILMGGPLTGASLNPARTIGPAIATGNYSDLWLYFTGPIGGALLAWIVHDFVLRSK